MQNPDIEVRKYSYYEVKHIPKDLPKMIEKLIILWKKANVSKWLDNSNKVKHSTDGSIEDWIDKFQKQVK